MQHRFSKPVTEAELNAWAEIRTQGQSRIIWRFGLLRFGVPAFFPLILLFALLIWRQWGDWWLGLNDALLEAIALTVGLLGLVLAASAIAFFIGAWTGVFRWKMREHRFILAQREPWRTYPPFEWRTSCRAEYKPMIPIAAILVPVYVANLFVYGASWHFSGIGTALLIMLPWIAFALWWFAFRRLLNRVRQSSYQLCLRCWYDMRGNPAATACPECGEPYDVRQARRYWRLFVYVRNPSRWKRIITSSIGVLHHRGHGSDRHTEESACPTSSRGQ